MLLNKVTAAALLTFLALGCTTSAALAAGPTANQSQPNSNSALTLLKTEDDSHDDGWGGGDGGSKHHDKNDGNSGWSAGGSTPLVMPPVVIKPDETETTPDSQNSWTPPSDDPNSVPSPEPSTLPFSVSPQSRPGTGLLPSTALSSQGGHHSFVVSPVSPADHPSMPGTQSLRGDSPTIHQPEQRIDPSRNQAVVISRMSISQQSPLQEFIDTALVVMAILGALSLGLVSVLVRSARVAKAGGRSPQASA